MTKPDSLEKWIRCCCGIIVGLVFGLLIVVKQLFDDTSSNLILAFSTTTLFGWLATRFGDRFWHKLMELWWLWW